MPFDVHFEKIPAGYSANAARAGEDCCVISREFTSTEDGQFFVRRLEGFPSELLDLVKPQKEFRPSSVDHMLAIIRKDGTCTAYINELSLSSVVRMRYPRSIEKGQPILKNDIVDVERIEFGDVEMPQDAGVVFLFSVGWRKGLYMDLTPITPEGRDGHVDYEALLGRLYKYVLFQELFKISDEDWAVLNAAGWFPFTSLKGETVDLLMSAVRAGWDVDDVLDRVSIDVDESLDLMVSAWTNHPAFSGHMGLLRNAIERYRAGDYASSVSILYSRIEGVLRSHKAIVLPSANSKQSTLAMAAVSSHSEGDMSLLLPHRFSKFLEEVYFADFDPTDPDIPVSRNSVGHGVANETAFTKKAAILGILVLHQLFYTFGSYGGVSSKQPKTDELLDV